MIVVVDYQTKITDTSLTDEERHELKKLHDEVCDIAKECDVAVLLKNEKRI